MSACVCNGEGDGRVEGGGDGKKRKRKKTAAGGKILLLRLGERSYLSQ